MRLASRKGVPKLKMREGRKKHMAQMGSPSATTIAADWNALAEGASLGTPGTLVLAALAIGGAHWLYHEYKRGVFASATGSGSVTPRTALPAHTTRARLPAYRNGQVTYDQATGAYTPRRTGA